MDLKRPVNIITISRQIGSLGREVAQIAAQTLGYKLYWRELINQAALRSGKPEVALAMIDELNLLGICPSPKDCQAYRQTIKEVMEEIYAEGESIIIGRAGQVILRHHPRAFHVRIIASPQARAERIATIQDVSFDCAMAQVTASDHHRQTYLRRFYKVRWDDPELYDLVINTERMSPEAAGAVICRAIQFPPALPRDIIHQESGLEQ